MLTPSHRFRLKDPNPTVREAAAMELIFAPEPELLPELLALLSDVDTDVRRTAIQALGALNDPQALDGLLLALLDPVPEVADTAQSALIKLGSASVEALYEWLEHTEWPQRAAALRGLCQLQPDPHRLVPLAQDAIWEVRGEAYLALGRFGSQANLRLTGTPVAMTALRQALASEQHPLAREALLAGLGAIQHPDALQLLLDMLLDPLTEESLQAVASALQAYGSAIHAPMLSAGIWAPDPDVRAMSAALLAQTNCPNLKNQLAPLLLDPQPYVRQTVAYAIYEADQSQAIWEFVAGLYHPDDHVFEAAVIELLAYPGAGAGERLLEALDVPHSQLRLNQLVRALGELKYEASSHVMVELLEPGADPVLLEALCWSLGQLGAWRAWHHLQRKLGHAHEGVRLQALEALIKIDPENATWVQLRYLDEMHGEPLRRLLSELASYPDSWGMLRRELFQRQDPDFRGAVLEAVKQFPPHMLRPLLEEYLNDWPQPQPETLEPLLALLDRVGLSENLARCLLSWIEVREEPVRSRVTRVLRPWAQTLKEELLAASLHDIWFVRQAALQTVGWLKDQEVLNALTTALKDRDRDVRISAITLLGKIEDLDITAPLLEALENGYRDIRAAAAQALTKRHDSWARKPLTNTLLEDEASEVRLAAALALGEMGLHEPEHRASIFEVLEEAYDLDDDPDVQAVVLNQMFRLEPGQTRPLVVKALKDEDDALRGMALKVYATAGWPIEPVVPQLEVLIRTGPEDQQAQALALLLPLRPDLLASWLESADESLRLACLQAIQPNQVLEHQIALACLLDDASPRIRQQTLRVLAHVTDLRPMLATRARREEDPSVLQTLVELLTELPVADVLPVYQEILERPTPHVHTSVIWALAPVMALGGGELLQATLPQAGPELRSQIFEVLATSPEVGLPVLTELIDHWDRDLVLRSTRALGRMGEPALVLLKEIWLREEMAQQLAVLSACEQLQLPETLPMLILAARSTH
ncbi:MAG: HEAT repeat domain-containing protein, partial [Candidatus Sericytochromatia bacterium]